jgi:ABC-type multidrug transport system fused ATPase/permease subunit
MLTLMTKKAKPL